MNGYRPGRCGLRGCGTLIRLFGRSVAEPDIVMISADDQKGEGTTPCAVAAPVSPLDLASAAPEDDGPSGTMAGDKSAGS